MSDKEKNKKPVLVENIDYYMENGFFVFTEKFHQDRGYCCKSGCRHCPYGFEKGRDNVGAKK
jgi:Family of unknown function (DUF5522)